MHDDARARDDPTGMDDEAIVGRACDRIDERDAADGEYLGRRARPVSRVFKHPAVSAAISFG